MNSRKAPVDANFNGGAVRSADGEHLDFASLPLVGLIAVARTAHEGATKYGRLNYMQGMSSHSLINRSMRHLVLHLLGDRSEPNLAHAAWGILSAIQSEVLDPELSAPHMLGPGATLTDANKRHLADNRQDLTNRRKAGEFAGIGDWDVRKLPEIEKLLGQRSKAKFSDSVSDYESIDEPADLPMSDGSGMDAGEFERALRRMILRGTGRDQFNTTYDPAHDGKANIASRNQAYDMETGGIVTLFDDKYPEEPLPDRPAIASEKLNDMAAKLDAALAEVEQMKAAARAKAGAEYKAVWSERDNKHLIALYSDEEVAKFRAEAEASDDAFKKAVAYALADVYPGSNAAYESLVKSGQRLKDQIPVNPAEYTGFDATACHGPPLDDLPRLHGPGC